MKLANHNIHTLAKKLFHHNQGVKRAKLMHPKRDWLVGVLVGVMIIVVMISWSAYTYLDKRSAIGLNDTGVEAQVPVYKAEVVEDALELFAQRKEIFNQLNQSTTVAIESPDMVVATTTSSTTDVVEEEQATEVVEEGELDPATNPEANPQDQPIEGGGDLDTPVLLE